MNEITQKVFDYLKKSGKVSGGKIKEDLGLKDSEYRAAKEELNNGGVVILGRGRGGTIELVDGAEPPAEPKKLSKSEIMAAAREEKAAKSREQKKHQAIIEKAKKIARDKFPDAETEVWIVDPISEIFHIWVWDETGKAKIYKGYNE